MNGVLWALQIVLAFAFLTVGWAHAFRSRQMAAGRPGMGWILAVPAPLMTFIGICEMAAGVAMILPGLTGIAPWLAPLAALMLSILMILALIFHALRTGEGRSIVLNFILFALAALVAYGRYAVVPL